MQALVVFKFSRSSPILSNTSESSTARCSLSWRTSAETGRVQGQCDFSRGIFLHRLDRAADAEYDASERATSGRLIARRLAKSVHTSGIPQGRTNMPMMICVMLLPILYDNMEQSRSSRYVLYITMFDQQYFATKVHSIYNSTNAKGCYRKLCTCGLKK